MWKRRQNELYADTFSEKVVFLIFHHLLACCAVVTTTLWAILAGHIVLISKILLIRIGRHFLVLNLKNEVKNVIKYFLWTC